jgi:predicted nucleic acid-binding protein
VEVAGWVLDKSAAVRFASPSVSQALTELSGALFLCPMSELEQLYSARSAQDYDAFKDTLHATFEIVAPPSDIFIRALRLQQQLAHHHGMWYRTPIPDLIIAETALHHQMGVVHVDGDFDRIAQVRPLPVRRLRP